VTGQDPSLLFSWSCMAGGEYLGDDCNLASSLQSTSKVVVGYLAEGTYIFTLTVAKGARSASASVTITVKSSAPPLASITTTSLGAKVNPQAKLVLPASVTDPTASFSCSWAITQGSLEGAAMLASVSRSGTTFTTTTAASLEATLVLRPGVLSPRTYYTMRLATSNSQASGFSEVSFWTVGTPTSGSLSVSPESGHALQTSFTITADDWTDDPDALPLVYSFSYVVGGDTAGAVEFPLAAGSFITRLETYLPPGNTSAGGLVTAVAYITNQYSAYTRTTGAVTVVANGNVSTEALFGNVSSALTDALESFDVEAVSRLAGTMAMVLNDGAQALQKSRRRTTSGGNATATERDSRTSIRSSLLGFLVNASALEDPADRDVSDRRSAVLMALTSSPDELSESATTDALGLMTSLASAATSGGISPMAMEASSHALSSLLDTDHATSSATAGGLSSVMADLAAAATVDLVPGEDAVQISTPNMQVASSVHYAENLRNVQLAPPGGSSFVQLPVDGLNSLFEVNSSTPVATAILGVKNLHTADKNSTVTSGSTLKMVVRGQGTPLTSSRRRLHAPLVPSQRWRRATISGYLTLKIQSTVNERVFTRTEHVRLNCSWDEYGTKVGACKAGQLFTLPCDGVEQERVYLCSTQNASVCGIWSEGGSTWDTSGCEVLYMTANSTVCQCRLPEGSNLAGGVDFAAVMGSIYRDFLSTLRVAPLLTPATIRKNLVVFLTIGIFLLTSGALAIALFYVDKREELKRQRKPEKGLEETGPSLGSAAVLPLPVPESGPHPDDPTAEPGSEIATATGGSDLLKTVMFEDEPGMDTPAEGTALHPQPSRLTLTLEDLQQVEAYTRSLSKLKATRGGKPRVNKPGAKGAPIAVKQKLKIISAKKKRRLRLPPPEEIEKEKEELKHRVNWLHGRIARLKDRARVYVTDASEGVAGGGANMTDTQEEQGGRDSPPGAGGGISSEAAQSQGLGETTVELDAPDFSYRHDDSESPDDEDAAAFETSTGGGSEGGLDMERLAAIHEVVRAQKYAASLARKSKRRPKLPAPAGPPPGRNRASSGRGGKLRVASAVSAQPATETTTVAAILDVAHPERRRGLLGLIAEELRQRHGWASMIVQYSPLVPRPLRVAIVSTGVITIMFCNSLFYRLLWPDSGPCSSYTSKSTCLAAPSPFDDALTNCVWDKYSKSCSFREPSNNLLNCLIVSVASSLVSTPLNAILAAIFAKCLMPRTRRKGIHVIGPESTSASPPEDPEELSSESVHKILASVYQPRGLLPCQGRQDARFRQSMRFRGRVEKEMYSFRAILLDQREHLLEEVDRAASPGPEAKEKLMEVGGPASRSKGELIEILKAFDRRWGIDPSGRFKRSSWWQRLVGRGGEERLRQRVEDELLVARAMERELKKLPNIAATRKLVATFRLVDRMPSAERAIFVRALRSSAVGPPADKTVPSALKAMGWVLVVLWNLAAGFYVILFGVRVGSATANAWLTAFAYHFIQDVLVCTPMAICFFYIYLPAHLRLRAAAGYYDQDDFDFPSSLPDGKLAT
jgi:hypothetical protein